MKLAQVRQFVALAELQNFHRAAEQLNMAQPPLSISIRKLEEEVGTPLFLRDPRGVTLTAAGEAALANARRVLFHAEQMHRAIRETIAGDRGRLRVGFVASATYRLLPALLRDFRAQFPRIEMKLEEARTAELLEAVEIGAIDVAIIRTPVLTPTSATIRILERDSLQVAVPRSHPLAGRRSIDLSELRDEPFVVFARESVPSMHAITMMVCQQAGFVPRVVEEAGQLQTIICLVESGLGVALVPGVAASHATAVNLIAIRNSEGSGAIGLGIVSGSGEISLAASRFCEFAVEQINTRKRRGRDG